MSLHSKCFKKFKLKIYQNRKVNYVCHKQFFEENLGNFHHPPCIGGALDVAPAHTMFLMVQSEDNSQKHIPLGIRIPL